MVKREGKPTKFLSSLENKKNVEKTIKYLELRNGKCVTGQIKILNPIRNYYVNLFDEKGSMDVNSFEILKNVWDIKICDSNLGDSITVKEIGQVLKRMKNNKCAGIDDFTSDFFKAFNSKLQYFIMNSINSCFKKEILSPTLRQGILVYLPKGNKNRKFIKNWRPISLLPHTNYHLES